MYAVITRALSGTRLWLTKSGRYSRNRDEALRHFLRPQAQMVADNLTEEGIQGSAFRVVDLNPERKGDQLITVLESLRRMLADDGQKEQAKIVAGLLVLPDSTLAYIHDAISQAALQAAAPKRRGVTARLKTLYGTPRQGLVA